MAKEYDVVILGAGAAGLSAGLYSTRAMLSTLMIESIGPGGQLLITDEIENYPGFQEGVKGQELATEMFNQANRFGAEMEYAEVEAVENLHDDRKLIRTSEGDFAARALIIATGGSHNKLGVLGEDEFAGRGVSYCAVCDGNFFRGQDVVVVGGGDAAMDESLDRAFANPKYKWLWSHVVEEFVGNDVLEAARVKDLKTGEVYDYPSAAAFIYVGFHPNTEPFKNILDMDELGHVYADIHMRTNVPKVYACGDARAESTRQLGAAVGDGITAALAAFHDLSS